ncbi:hypothetical protein F5883DRAFT_653867 [Diaporthe sp. PMI_573]|nr:hypothetical protein F5883DRAFT_653867 [Diaporthaceae sp. PMI_573]
MAVISDLIAVPLSVSFTPEGKLYLVYQKQISKPPKRDGVFAWPLKDPITLATDNATLLLGPDEGLNSENYHNHSDNTFKLIETGNIRAINGKFLMAYSVGAYNRPTYKLAVAYSDTFLPKNGQQYRKVMKENPDELWGSKSQKEVYERHTMATNQSLDLGPANESLEPRL